MHTFRGDFSADAMVLASKSVGNISLRTVCCFGIKVFAYTYKTFDHSSMLYIDIVISWKLMIFVTTDK